MKRALFSALVIVSSFGMLATAVNAEQVGPDSRKADLNGDGQVTLTELKAYNRSQRDS